MSKFKTVCTKLVFKNEMTDATKRELRKHDSKYGNRSTEPVESVENLVIWSL